MKMNVKSNKALTQSYSATQKPKSAFFVTLSSINHNRCMWNPSYLSIDQRHLGFVPTEKEARGPIYTYMKEL